MPGKAHAALALALALACALAACERGGSPDRSSQPASSEESRAIDALLASADAPPRIDRSASPEGVVEVPPSSETALDVSAFAALRTPREGARLDVITVYGRPDTKSAGAAQVRAVLGFDGVASFRTSERPAGAGLPHSVFLDFERVRLSPALSSLVSVGAGGLERIRAFALDESRTRVSFDLAADAAHRVFFLTNPYRVIVDFRVSPPRPLDARAAVVRTIVLDPGHGGTQGGARGPGGLEESAVALSLALRVKKALRAMLPATRIVLTRTANRTVTLEERAAIANGAQADLFVSIHLNASPSPKDRGGVSTYVLDTSDDVQALRLAARENDAAEQDVTDMQRLFASLYRKDQVAHSLDLAGEIQRATLVGGRRVLPDLEDRGVKKALFYVLVGATMPAVLCEASFITRPEEAAALATDAYRDALADGMARGIVAYTRRADGDGARVAR